VSKVQSTGGHEFATVSRRKRRCGWFDAVLVPQAVAVFTDLQDLRGWPVRFGPTFGAQNPIDEARQTDRNPRATGVQRFHKEDQESLNTVP
jgi:hypothetical protein